MPWGIIGGQLRELWGPMTRSRFRRRAIVAGLAGIGSLCFVTGPAAAQAGAACIAVGSSAANGSGKTLIEAYSG